MEDLPTKRNEFFYFYVHYIVRSTIRYLCIDDLNLLVFSYRNVSIMYACYDVALILVDHTVDIAAAAVVLC